MSQRVETSARALKRKYDGLYLTVTYQVTVTFSLIKRKTRTNIVGWRQNNTFVFHSFIVYHWDIGYISRTCITVWNQIGYKILLSLFVFCKAKLERNWLTINNIMQSTCRCLYSYIHTLETSQIKRFLSLNSFDMTYKLNIKITCLIKYTRE